nr:palindromic element RPE1 domain-containing protein [Candidatus Trichorickettsia mobilis]
MNLLIRPLAKLASERGFEGDTAPRPAAYFWFVSDSSTGSTYKSSAEVEFRMRSIKRFNCSFMLSIVLSSCTSCLNTFLK